MSAAWQHAVGWALIHSLWQGAAIAAALAAALRLLRRARPEARYLASCAALALMVAAPAATGAWMAADGERVAASSLAGEVAPPAWRGVHLTLAGGADAVATGGGDAGAPAWMPRVDVERLVPGLVAAWAAGVVLLTLRLLGGWLWVRRLARRSVAAVPPEWAATVDALRARLGIRRRVRVALSARVDVPMLLGWLRPVILLPLSASSGLTPRQVELLLLHELAHVRRWDVAVNLLQRLAETLLFHHPATWWVSARIRAEREHCCDDAVVARSGVREYVHALLAMEEARAPHPMLAVAADGGSLLGRVRRLVGVEAPAARTQGASTALAAAALAVLAAACLAPGTDAEPRADGAATVAASPSTATTPTTTSASSDDDACGGDAVEAGSTRCGEASRRARALLAGAGVPGAVLVQDVATGAVVALETSGAPGAVDVTRPVLPASIWKLAIAAAWWDRGWASEAASCPASVDVGGGTVRNAGRAARASMRVPEEMLVHSCNTAAVEMTLRLGRDGGADALRRQLAGFGFAAGAGAGERDSAFWLASSPAAVAGLAPSPSSVALADAGPESLSRLALGLQGVRVTPLHISRFLQAVGNGGVMRRPTLEAALARGGGGSRVMRASTAERLQAAMLQTVAEGTAAGSARAVETGAWRLGGKTGTSAGEAGGEGDGWFAGLVFGPDGRPRYTVLTYLRGGGPGGGAPTRIAAEMVPALAGVGK
jgi:beta-lactamase regulating signal transducer with metallopeptidase domain